jgi:hypothetical protein
VYTRYLLVGRGKHGADAITAGLDGRWADLTGTRIARGEREMLEVQSDGIALASPASASPELDVPPPVSLGRQTLSGEVVDSKCWLGVMHPSTGSVHRGCATRCVSGGIPPLLMTRDSTGAVRHYLLTDSAGRPARQFVRLLGYPVRLTGEVIQDGDLLILRAATTGS